MYWQVSSLDEIVWVATNAIYSIHLKTHSRSSGLAGFSLAFAMESLAATQKTLHHGSEVHSLTQSVGNVIAYIQLAEEPGYAEITKLPTRWPTEGALEVCNLSLARRGGSSNSRGRVHFKVRGGEHVGVAVGGGSGVASLSDALFRMPNISGRVTVDHVDIRKLNLQEARKCMTLVSKDAMLFPGSVRDTLDPGKGVSDDALWLALEAVQLRTVIEALPGKLDCDVRESGTEFTETQRLLMYVARALLLKTKLLIVEEDSGPNLAVRGVISTLFRSSTMLTISRCSDPANYFDRLLVLKEGRIVENGRSEPQVPAI